MLGTGTAARYPAFSESESDVPGDTVPTPDGDKDSELMSIGQLAAAAGVSSRTIRYYEELGILPEPARSPGGTRKYPKEYQFYIEGALVLKELGFTLDEIRLVGRLALEMPMTARERKQVARVVETKMERLQHKLDVLNRLRGVLQDESGRLGSGRQQLEEYLSDYARGPAAGRAP
jgi:DNA-binding transcriptional MerR regulator